MPAIDHQHSTVDVTRRVRAEKYCGRFDVLDQAKAAERDALPKLLFDRFRYEVLHAFGVFNGTGRDGVHANAIASPFNREIASKRIDACLGGRHVKLHWRAEIVKRGADVENLTAMFLQLCQCRATDVERSLQIDIDHRAESVWREFFGFAKKISRGPVDDNIDL